MILAHLGLGANTGEPQAQIKAALMALAKLGGISLVRASSLYRSNPWGHPSQGSFVNAACTVETRLCPRDLLQALQGLEREAGRVDPGNPGRSGPRLLDLDILTFGNQILDRPDLKIPHPSLPYRSFVLVPLSEIDAFWNHPVLGETVGELLAKLSPVYDVQWIEHPPWNRS